MTNTPATTVSPRFLSVAPHFTVPDVVGAASYYRDVLGFENRCFFGDPPVFVMFNQDPRVAGQVRPRAAVAYDAYVRITGEDQLAEELVKRGARGPGLSQNGSRGQAARPLGPGPWGG